MTNDIVRLLLGPFSSLILLVLLLYGGRAKWWVFGWYAVEVVKERDMWREQALRGMKIAQAVSSVIVDENGTKK